MNRDHAHIYRAHRHSLCLSAPAYRAAVIVMDQAKLANLRRREDSTFSANTARSAQLHARAGRHMPGGVPMAWMKGLYRTPPIFVSHGEGATFFDHANAAARQLAPLPLDTIAHLPQMRAT